MSIKACIFDLDGVIVDTAKYHFLAWRKLADELNINFTKEDNEKLKGVSRMKSLEIILDLGKLQFDDETKNKLAEKKNKWYLEYIQKLDKSEVLPGVEKFLTDLRQQGIKIALGSASKNARLILKNIQMENYFDAIIDGTKITKAKPDPEVFLASAEELHIKPEECVVFEDAEAGVQAALRGGMKAVGIGSEKILHEANKVIPGFSGVSSDFIKNL